MNTKVAYQSQNANIPAGIVDGTGLELFGRDSKSKQLYAIFNGETMLFEQLPLDVRLPFYNAAMADKKGLKALRKKFNLTGHQAEFRQWLWCKFSGIDSGADLKDGKISPDSFNNLCKDYTCELRGIVCNVPSGLKAYEVLTLVYVVNGYSTAAMAGKLFITEAAVKSRIQTLKNKMNARNMAQLSAKAVKMGLSA